MPASFDCHRPFQTTVLLLTNPPQTSHIAVKRVPSHLRTYYSPSSSRFRDWVPLHESADSNGSHLAHSFCSVSLKITAKWGFLGQGKQTHAHMIKLGLYNGSLSLQNQLLDVYVKCKELHDAEKLFNEMLVRNRVTWNTMICGAVYRVNNQNYSLLLGFSYFRRMLLRKVGLDHITFNGLLRACIELNDIEAGRQLHCLIVKLDFDLDCIVSSALVDFYGKCGLVEEARGAFDIVFSKDLVLWNVMVSCYALNSLPVEAFGAFDLMRQDGLTGDEFTFSSLLNSCGILGSCELGKQIHGLLVKLSFALDIQVASALVDMYAKNENIDDARKCFDGMTHRNVVSWNTIMVAYGQHGDGKEAIRLLREMFRENFLPDELTLASVLSSSGNASVVCEITLVHACVVKSGFQAFLSIANALINSYSKCGSIASAFQCFSSAVEPDLVTWTSIISAFAFHGLSIESIQNFEEMLSTNVRPDGIAFLGILSACSHGGLVTEGLHYFNLMTRKYQIKPNSAHYTCLIDLLGRAGHLDEAFRVLTSMALEPKSETLGAFIGACTAHGNIKLAKWAAEKLVAMEPNKPVNFSLLSNIYASEGNWSEVSRVHIRMRESCVCKDPGCSWLETAGDVDIFPSCDKSHS